MGDQIAAAAAALGAPEDLVRRSADARATADGVSVDDILAAWAGGAPAPVAAAPESAAAEAPAEEAAPAPKEAPAPAAAPAAAPVAVAAAPASNVTPVLEGQNNRPLATLLGIGALFFVGLLVALIVPRSTGGDYNHLVPDAEISAVGAEGLGVYLREGCWYCHTQLVRPVLADVGLGPVTETFSDPIDTAAFGVQRIGPDLAHIGSRGSLTGSEGDVTADELNQLLTDPHGVNPDGLHPSYSYLSDSDLEALVTYLLELK